MSLQVLIVDDSATIREILRKGLVEILPDCQVFECETALEAGRFMLQMIPEVLFLDLNMPGVSGLTFLEKLDVILAGRRPPIIVSISSDVQPATMAALKQRGAYDTLTKPFQQKDMALLILRVIRMVHSSRVLLVDDSTTTRVLIRRIITRSRFNVVLDECENGNDAVRLAARNHYHAIFLDLNMPGIDGLEAAGDILYNRPETNIVMMSTDGQEQSRRAAMHIGVKLYLTKPFYAGDVDAVFHSIFDMTNAKFVEGMEMEEFEDVSGEFVFII